MKLKVSQRDQQMTVTFTNNSNVWVKPIVGGSAASKVNFLDALSVIKQGETKSYRFTISSTYGLPDKKLIFTAQQVMTE